MCVGSALCVGCTIPTVRLAGCLGSNIVRAIVDRQMQGVYRWTIAGVVVRMCVGSALCVGCTIPAVGLTGCLRSNIVRTVVNRQM